MEFSEELARNITDSFKAIADATQRITETASMLTCMMTKLVIQSDIAKCSKYVDKYINRSLGGKKKEQEQSEGEPNDFEITLNDCMLAAQQYPPGKIGWDNVKMWAEELSNYCPQPKQEWSEEDKKMIDHLIEALPMWATGRIAMLPSQADEYVKRLKSLRPSWKPSEEQPTVDVSDLLVVESSKNNPET